MESPVGKIVSIDDGKATVAVPRRAACPRCAAGKGCGAGLLSGSTRPALLEVSVSAGQRYREGDEVRLTLEPSHLLRATMLVYGLPLGGTVLMLLLGWLLMDPLSDAAAVGFAVAGLAAGLLAGRWQLNRRDCLKYFVPGIEGAQMPVSESAQRSRILVYSRPGCHLCELLIEELAPLVRGKLELEVRDIDTRPDWKLQYGVLIPVVEYGGKTVCQHRLDVAAIRNILESLPAS